MRNLTIVRQRRRITSLKAQLAEAQEMYAEVQERLAIAVEAMRKALEAASCTCHRYCPECDNETVIGVAGSPLCVACHMYFQPAQLRIVKCANCAALAAWKEATRG